MEEHKEPTRNNRQPEGGDTSEHSLFVELFGQEIYDQLIEEGRQSTQYGSFARAAIMALYTEKIGRPGAHVERHEPSEEKDEDGSENQFHESKPS